MTNYYACLDEETSSAFEFPFTRNATEKELFDYIVNGKLLPTPAYHPFFADNAWEKATPHIMWADMC